MRVSEAKYLEKRMEPAQSCFLWCLERKFRDDWCMIRRLLVLARRFIDPRAYICRVSDQAPVLIGKMGCSSPRRRRFFDR
jgi:hypothetical protein